MTDQIERELTVDAPVADVWKAVTAPGWLADEVELELWAGGEARFRTGEAERRGWIEQVAPPADGTSGPARLSFWWAEGDEPASRVELTISPLQATRSRLRVVEARPLDLLDLVGTPLPAEGGRTYGPALVAA